MSLVRGLMGQPQFTEGLSEAPPNPCVGLIRYPQEGDRL